MENDNIRNDENLQEESVIDEACETVEEGIEIQDAMVENSVEASEKAAVETAEDAETEETEETEEDLIGDEWKTDEAELPEAEEESGDAEAEEAVEFSEEEIAAINALKKKKRKRNIIIAAAVAAVLAIVAFFVCYTEGVGSKTLVNHPSISSESEDTGFWAKLKTDNIRYENPVVTLFEKIIGKNKDAAMKVNGVAVDKDVLNFVANSSGLNCVYSLLQAGMITDIESFDWNTVAEEMNISYGEISKAMAVETLIPIYAVIAEGEKRGVEFTEEDDKNIKDWIAEQKESYGEEFETILKQSGYADEDTLYEIQKIQLYMQKVYENIEQNISDYVTPSIKKSLSDDKVTVKHILICFESDEDGEITDDAKNSAKEKAEEVLVKVKGGEDFDKLVEEYNEDPGATDEGYTFAQDGTMVEAFEDASFALNVGEVSELVETPYGYHIIKRIERAVTADDYITALQKNVPVNIKKGVFDKMSITINLEDYFGAPETDETSETGETAE